MGDLYVVLTWENGSPQLCYDIGREPFIGSFEAAKSLQNDLTEWHPEHEYKIYKLSDVV